MYKKSVLSMLGVSVLLSACSNTITEIDPLTMEEVAGTRLAQMSIDEKEGMIYQFVSDRITVDKDNLIDIDSSDKVKIDRLLNQVEENLQGVRNNDSLSEEYSNYLLMEFGKTPYQWQRTSIDTVGFDPSARLYFVDVTYKTTNKLKRVVPESKIPMGSPDEEVLKQKRYTDYLGMLSQRGVSTPEDIAKQRSDFEKAWGTIASITEEQQGVSLLDRTRSEQRANESDGIGRLTYSGLVQNSRFNDGAEMTFRYVFKYRYNLGEETDLEVESLYLKDYSFKDHEILVEGLDSGDYTGVEVLRPFIDQLIQSYHKAVGSANSKGLHSLYFNYAGVDKYYDDLSKYTYNTIGGYNFEVLNRSGTDVTVLVTRENKIRAKGADMSLPTYRETLIYNLVLDKDDKIKINGVHLLKSELVGEPMSVIQNVSGVSDRIQYSGESFTASNKEAVEQAIKDFSEVVFNAQVDSKGFTDIVDIGISDNTLQKISDIVVAVPNSDRKLTYVVSWDTTTNVFASVTIREIFDRGENSLDTEAVLDLINRDGEWQVVNYTRTMNVQTAGVTLDTRNALIEHTR